MATVENLIKFAPNLKHYSELCAVSPKEVHNFWKWFLALTEVPRRSHYHEKVVAFLKHAAELLKVEFKVDAANNCLFKAEGNAQGAKGVILQGHSDMVPTPFPCEYHKWDEEPVVIKINGDIMTADRTTLGADDGTGVAMALAMLENRDQFKHGPIEVLITSDEEVGLLGAAELKEGFLEGKYLVNIDSEDWGIITVSSAGTAQRALTIPYQVEPAGENQVMLHIKLSGLKGGHSGVNINGGPANAIKWMGDVVYDLTKFCSGRLVNLVGGHAHNAVPSSCEANVVVPAAEVEHAIERAKVTFHSFMLRYAAIENMDPSITVTNKKEVAKTLNVLHHNSTLNMVHSIEQIPHGVIRYFADSSLPDLVETSQNLARANIPEKEGSNIANFQVFARSAVDHYMAGVTVMDEKIAVAHGGKCTLMNTDVGGWPADLSSRLLKEMKEAYKSMEGKYPETMAIHAGLENSVIMNKYPKLGLESVSVGPTVQNPHTTYESLTISTAVKCYELVKRTVEALAK